MINPEALRREREESSNAVFIAFNRHISKGKIGLFCFFEGKDSPYYMLRITRFFAGKVYPFRCSGRDKVLKIYELISYHTEYAKYLKAYFIDRDFNQANTNPDIYETPCYSIENLYTSADTFSLILKSELGMYETSEDYIRSMDLYENLQAEFHEAATLFNAWYACLIDYRNEKSEKINVKLKNTIPAKFLTFDLSGVTSSYDYDDLKTEYVDAPAILNDVLNEKLEFTNSCEKRKFFRGKFEFDFLLKFIELLVNDSKNEKTVIEKRIKYNISHDQAIALFSQYAKTPPCLIEYMERITS